MLMPNRDTSQEKFETQSKRVGIYARVSTGSQENEQTINSQIDEIRQKIKKDGNTILEKYVSVDDGWTGTILSRPGLDNLRDFVKLKEIQMIYVYGSPKTRCQI